jgi:hypothetical protein
LRGGAPAKGSTGRIAAQRTLDQALEPVNSRARLGQDAVKQKHDGMKADRVGFNKKTDSVPG